MIERDEWDFRDVVANEVLPCAYWEFARESARIRAYYSEEGSEFFPGPDIQTEIRRADGSLSSPPPSPVTNPLRMRFIEQIWSYALPLKTVHEKACAAGLREDSLSYSWQRLPEAVRQEVVSELTPYFAEHPALTFLPFNRCSDLRDINMADEDYRCAELDIETGIERLRVEISWADFTDKQILRAFKIWLRENRPRGFGRADERGKKKVGACLGWLGILRLMHVYPFTSLRQAKPEAWSLYRSADWPRARKLAGRVFHQLFPFLPMNDKPIHWQTAGGRGR